MASSSSAPHHARSNSSPNIISTLASKFDEQLNRLRSSESASCSTTSSISYKITHLSSLYECIDEFLQLPFSGKALSCQGKWIEESLEGSIKILDICTNISEAMVQMKERAQELQSILRRRCSEDEIAAEVAQYLKSRKKAIKTLSKELKNLKKIENKYVVESFEMADVISRLSECQVATLKSLESVLVGIVGPKAQRSGLESAVSKLLKSKRITSQQETESFLVGFESTSVNLNQEEVRSRLGNMEICIKDVEQGLQQLVRHLIKTRTTILNILNC